MTIQGAGQLGGSMMPAGPPGPAAWLPVSAWSPSVNYGPGPPAAVVTYAGSTYVCTTPHLSGFVFDATKWTQIAVAGVNGTGLVYRGAWNAATNIPALASGVGVLGNFYKVSTAGTTALDSCNTWEINDILVFDGNEWDKFEGPSETFSQLTISPVGRVLPTPSSGTLLQLGNLDGTSARVEAVSFGNASRYTCVRYDGTLLAPTALVVNDQICSFGASGYNGISVAGVGGLKCYAAENWAAGHQGCYWRLGVTAIATTAAVDALSVENDGGVCIPPTVTGSTQGAGTLNLNAVYIAGVLQKILSAPNTLQNAANDAAAAALTPAVPVGGLYRNGSIIMVRIA